MDNRKQITNGIRWYRWIFVITASLCFLYIANGQYLEWTITSFLISLLLIRILYNSPRLELYGESLYIIRGKEEEAVSFKKISKIRKTRTKINGRRMWKVIYEDETGIKRTRRFIPIIFAPMSNFCDGVKKTNPDVVIEWPIVL